MCTLFYLEVLVDLAYHLAQGDQDLHGYREYPLLLVVRLNLRNNKEDHEVTQLNEVIKRIDFFKF